MKKDFYWRFRVDFLSCTLDFTTLENVYIHKQLCHCIKGNIQKIIIGAFK